MQLLLGEGIVADVEEDGAELVLHIDLQREGRPSRSGKTLIVATTGGNKEIPGSGGIRVGVNAYKRNPDYEE